MSIKVKLVVLFFVTVLTIISSVVMYLPIGYSLVLPIQHFVNVIVAVLLGPWYAVAGAFVVSLFRNLIGTGTIFAFPGSMIGALLAGILFTRTKKLSFAFVGEAVGSGFIGAFVAYLIGIKMIDGPVILQNILFPFLFSSLLGAIMAFSVLKLLERNKTIGYFIESRKG